MKKTKIILIIFCVLQLLGCENIKKGLGIEKSSPNELLVEKRQSILLPPDYNLIPPDSKKEFKQTIEEEEINSLLNKELNKNNKIDFEKKNSNINSKSNKIENIVLDNIK